MSIPDEPEEVRVVEFELLPDSVDGRRFLDLMHFAGAELSPAVAALRLAAECREREEDDMAGFLVDFAVVSYCRAFLSSSVRRPLGENIEVPAQFAGIHEQVRTYRNTTVAHSQSELATTWPLVVTLASEPGRRRIWAPTLTQPLPPGVVGEFQTLVEAVLEIVETRAEELLLELEAKIQPPVRLRRASMIDAFPAELERDFTARSHRRPIPTRQTIFWSLSEPSGES
ncbi:hypothetical protein [Agromyces sp. NPDC049794]|uniref:hypothetical protein n=1 Tax=unclassified Agromyces TaxID=2639701 RepID=UPI0033FE73BF